jgi:pimeloyl-ACP methyl ester carboxylesterase
MRLLYQASGDSKLHYWGFSYGTVLGSVFSDMFPNEVGRVALDGTVDVPDYIAGNWSTNLVDTQGTYEEGLINECVKAGEKCALNKLTNGTDLKTLLDDFYKVLIQEPMISTKTDTPFLDYSAFKGAIFSTLYSSYGWPNITKAMAEAIQGNATGFIKEFIDVESPPEPTPASPHAFVAIAGGDALERREHTWDLQDYKVSRMG